MLRDQLQRRPWIFGILLASFGLLGCGDKPKPAAPASNPAPAPNRAEQAAEEKRQVRDLFSKSKALEYAYNPVGKRDPFKESSASTQIVQLERGGPLTQYELDQMRLVAVIWGISDPRGMVQLPDGKSYIIKRNTPMGRHYGKVARITPSSIVVEEEFRGPLGDLQVKESSLLLNPEGEAANAFSDEAATGTSAPGLGK